MTLRSLTKAAALPAALLLFLLWAGGAQAQNTTPPPNSQVAPSEANSYQGTIASIDPAHQAFVVNTVLGDQTATIETGEKTHFTKAVDIKVTGLQVGDNVVVHGAVDPAELTVMARRIEVRKGKHPGGGADVEAGRAVAGTIGQISPKITVAGDDGKIYTVILVKQDIPVIAQQPASFSDLAVGENVAAHGKPAGAGTLAARSVDIRPAGAIRGGHRRHAPAL